VEWMRPNADHATHARTPYRSRRRGQVRGTAPFSPLRGETVYVHVHVHVHVQGWGGGVFGARAIESWTYPMRTTDLTNDECSPTIQTVE
jgi:hypothetical protein